MLWKPDILRPKQEHSSRDNIIIAAKNFWESPKGLTLPVDTYEDLLWKKFLNFLKFLNSEEMLGLESCFI